MSSSSKNNVYSALALCHGVYIAEFDQLKGPFVLPERPKCFENAKFQQIVAGLPLHNQLGGASGNGGIGLSSSSGASMTMMMGNINNGASNNLMNSALQNNNNNINNNNGAMMPSPLFGRNPSAAMFSAFSESPTPNTLGAGGVFEAHGRLLETADKIARRLLAGSVDDGSEFLEVEGFEDDDDEEEEEEEANEEEEVENEKETKKQHDQKKATTTTRIQNHKNRTKRLSKTERAALREKRHHFFSIFLDAVPISKKLNSATAQLYGAPTPPIASSSSISSSLSPGSTSTTAGGYNTTVNNRTLNADGSTNNGSFVMSSAITNNNNYYSQPKSTSSSSSSLPVRVYVQNDAALEMCVVCACTFALPDVFARGYRRDVTIFAICPRMNWSKIAPKVSESLRILGRRMCDNAMAMFLYDVERVAGAVTRVFRRLQQQVKEEQEEIERMKKEEELIAAAVAAESTSSNIVVASSSSPVTRKPQTHFKLRRTEEEFHCMTSLAKKMRILKENIMKENQQEREGNVDDHEEVLSISTASEMISEEEDEKLATKCRSRGQEALRGIGELCPLVWDEDFPSEEATKLVLTRKDQLRAPNNNNNMKKSGIVSPPEKALFIKKSPSIPTTLTTPTTSTTIPNVSLGDNPTAAMSNNNSNNNDDDTTTDDTPKDPPPEVSTTQPQFSHSHQTNNNTNHNDEKSQLAPIITALNIQSLSPATTTFSETSSSLKTVEFTPGEAGSVTHGVADFRRYENNNKNFSKNIHLENSNNNKNNQPNQTKAASHGHFPSNPVSPVNSSFASKQQAMKKNIRRKYQNNNYHQKNRRGNDLDGDDLFGSPISLACTERHWDAAHILLARFAPLIMGQQQLNQSSNSSTSSSSSQQAIMNNNNTSSNFIGTYSNQNGMTNNNNSSRQQIIYDQVVGGRTPMETNSVPQSPLTSSNNNNNAGFNARYAATTIASTIVNGNNQPVQQQQKENIIQFYNYNGKYHEMKWNLRGYVFAPKLVLKNKKKKSNNGQISSSGFFDDVNFNNNNFYSPAGFHREFFGSGILGTTEPYQKRKLREIQQFILVNTMRKLLPSIYVPSREVFPAIVVGQNEPIEEQRRRDAKRRRKEEERNARRKRRAEKESKSSNKNGTKQQQQQTTTSSQVGTTSNMPMMMKPFELPAKLKSQQEKVNAQFFTDGPGQFYKKYKHGVDGLRSEAAKQCVLPTIALFPAFCERRY